VSFREAFPILSVDDVDRAVDFYTSVFGFEKTFSFEQDGAIPYAYLQLGQCTSGGLTGRRAACSMSP
jgi:predicted enzyme related to lactoylglutathione lyase